MTVLDIRSVTVRRGGRAVVDSVSARLEAGMCVALIGANGAGKSTLLSAVAGLIRPQAGEVLLDGSPVSSIPRRELARRRAYLPQNPRADWPIPVERLVALGLTPELPPFGALPFEPRLTEVIEACDLAAQRRQPATTLSGGELARAMLARALIGSPDILLADEPAAGLDPRHGLDAARRLRRLAVEEGRLVVAALHDLTLAARYATHLMALKKGRLAAFGPMAEILTADLLREVFEVEVKIVGAGERAYVDYAGAAER